MPDRDKSLLDCFVDLDDGEDYIEVIRFNPNVNINNISAPNEVKTELSALTVPDELSEIDSSVTTTREREHMIDYLINSYKKEEIYLQKSSYDIAHLQRLAEDIKALSRESTSCQKSDGDDVILLSDEALSTQPNKDSEDKLNTKKKVTQKKKKISRCIYCSLQVDSLRSLNLPKDDAILNKWLKSLSRGDVHVEAWLRKRLNVQTTKYVLCDLHYDPTQVASFLMGYKLPWPKLLL